MQELRTEPRQQRSQQSVQAILDLARMKEEGRCKKLVVAGCLTQRYPDEMAREIGFFAAAAEPVGPLGVDLKAKSRERAPTA